MSRLMTYKAAKTFWYWLEANALAEQYVQGSLEGRIKLAEQFWSNEKVKKHQIQKLNQNLRKHGKKIPMASKKKLNGVSKIGDIKRKKERNPPINDDKLYDWIEHLYNEENFQKYDSLDVAGRHKMMEEFFGQPIGSKQFYRTQKRTGFEYRKARRFSSEWHVNKPNRGGKVTPTTEWERTNRKAFKENPDLLVTQVLGIQQELAEDLSKAFGKMSASMNLILKGLANAKEDKNSLF